MQVVAGPSGSGKSSLFPVSATGVDHFNVDDRCAQLNGGSYLGITPDIRAQAPSARRSSRVTSRRGRASPSKLRSGPTSRSGKRQRRGPTASCFSWNASRRAALRSASGLKSLLRVLREFDIVTVYDNSRRRRPPVRVLVAAAGRRTTYRAKRVPTWLGHVLKGSEFA